MNKFTFFNTEYHFLVNNQSNYNISIKKLSIVFIGISINYANFMKWRGNISCQSTI